MIWAIILAAGESVRMGEPKLLLPLEGKTIIEKVIETALKSKADKTMVVVGANRKKILKHLKSYPVEVVENTNYRQGMASSIQKGMAAVPAKVKACVIILGDQPFISSEVIDTLVDCFHKTGKGIVLPVFKKKRGHPLLIAIKYRDEAQKLNPAIGLRELVHNHPEDIQEVEVDCPGILKDIDTLEDYHQREERGASHEKKGSF